MTEQTSDSKKWSRRSFMKLGAGVAGTGLVVGVAYQHRFGIAFQVMDYMANKNFEPNAFIIIPKKGKIQFVCHRSEMGQGVRTSLPMLLAEELEVSMDSIEIVQADADPKYGSQNTDGSTSIQNFYYRLRQAAAATRELLLFVAAQRWSVHTSECKAHNGRILHTRSKRSLGYGDLVEEASKHALPKQPKLKQSKDFHTIGKPHIGVDVDAYTQGKARFGADVEVPHMLYACAKRSPTPGATIKSIDTSKASKVKGVHKIIKIDPMPASSNVNASVCVVANNTWSAMQARDQLRVEWDTSKVHAESSAAFLVKQRASLERPSTTFRSEGNLSNALAKHKGRLQAEYHTPYLVHAPMEPLVCTAHVQKETCEVWAPTQDPMRARKLIAEFLRYPIEKVTVHVTFLGGGFGRKSQADFVLEAVAASKQIGRPIKLQWTREDEIQHGFYHAESLHQLSAAIDSKGVPAAWHHKLVHPSMLTVMMPKTDEPSAFEAGMGATNIPYAIPTILVQGGKSTSPARIGWYRSVANLWNAFAVNSFVDELAESAKQDPIAYRKRLIGPKRTFKGLMDKVPQQTERLIRVIEHTQKAFGWDKVLPKGRGKGFANHYSFNSYVAAAIEVSVQQGNVRVHRVVTTIDCGLAVNPESERAQMEGAIVFGLSAALYGKITLDAQGAVQQSNFHDYPLLRMMDMPQMDIHIINGDPSTPTGVGEPGVPPIPPALTAAIHNATGQRIRRLPIIDSISKT